MVCNYMLYHQGGVNHDYFNLTMFFQRGYVLCVSKVFVQDFQSTCKLSRNKPCGRENSTCSAVARSPTGMNKKIVTSYQTVSLHTKQLLYMHMTLQVDFSVAGLGINLKLLPPAPLLGNPQVHVFVICTRDVRSLTRNAFP